jgi:hypothetical protein
LFIGSYVMGTAEHQARALQVRSRQVKQGVGSQLIGVALPDLRHLDDAHRKQFADGRSLVGRGERSGAPLSLTAFHASSNAWVKTLTSSASNAPARACFSRTQSMGCSYRKLYRLGAASTRHPHTGDLDLARTSVPERMIRDSRIAKICHRMT